MNLVRLVKSKFLRDSVTLQLGSLLTAVGNLVSTVILANMLGSALYGIYVVATALYALAFLLLSTGFVQITVSQVARFSAAKDSERAAQWLAFLAKVYFILGLSLVVAGWFVVPPLVALWGEVTPGHMAVDPRDLGLWVFWLAFIPLLDLPRVVAIAAFQGTRRMLPLAQVDNAAEIARVFLVICGGLITADPTGPLIGTILASGVGSVVAVERYRRARKDGGYPLPGVKQLVSLLRAVPLREGVTGGMKIGVMRSCDALALNAFPPLILQTFTSSSWVAYFRIAHRLMNFPVTLMGGVSRTALPALSELAGIQDMQRFKRVFLRITLGGGAIVIAGVALFLPLIPYATDFLMPHDFVAPVTLLSRILALGFISVGFGMAIDSFYIVTGKMHVGIVLGVVGFFVTVGTSILLAWLMPETGAAWGMVFSMAWVMTNLVYIWWYFHTGRGAALQPAKPGAKVVGA